MAKLCCGSMHQQLLQPRWRTMATTAGLCCEGMRQPVGCSSGHGVHSVAWMIQPRRVEVAGMRTKVKVPRCTSVRENSQSRPDIGSAASSAAFRDSAAADSSGRREEAESAAASDGLAVNENLWRFELETLVRGHVGRFAFLAILLLGVGVGCLANVADAEAAVSHVSSGNGGVDVDMRSLAVGPEGPLLEEFWDNMRRYGLYFVTVVTGGVYQLVKPAVDALRNPVTGVLIVIIVTGSLYLVALTVSAMLGINEFQYDYAL